MSTINHSVVARRLTTDRLAPYLAASAGDLPRAFDLYDWNTEVSGAFYEDISRLEVVFRNTLDAALVNYGCTQGWATVWFRRRQLFPGRHSLRALEDIEVARRRATSRRRPEVHGKVIAELGFGFWRYLCAAQYLTSLWIPALAVAFPGHPTPDDPRSVRRDVEDRAQRLHFLRNRVAHQEPVHQRDLRHDHDSLVELAGWICPDTQAWIVGASRCREVLARRA